MIQTIEVTPSPTGWTVRSEALPGETTFAGGAAAEAAARRLAEQLSAAGEAVRVVVKLKDGSTGGRFIYPPRWLSSHGARQPGAAAAPDLGPASDALVLFGS